MTELIFAGMILAGGAVIVLTTLSLLATGHRPRVGDRVSIGWGAVVAIANIALAVAWYLERGVAFGPLVFALLAVLAMAFSIVRLHGYLLKRKPL